MDTDLRTERQSGRVPVEGREREPLGSCRCCPVERCLLRRCRGESWGPGRVLLVSVREYVVRVGQGNGRRDPSTLETMGRVGPEDDRDWSEGVRDRLRFRRPVPACRVQILFRSNSGGPLGGVGVWVRRRVRSFPHYVSSARSA